MLLPQIFKGRASLTCRACYQKLRLAPSRHCSSATAATQVLDKAGVWAFGSGSGGEFGMDPARLGRESALARPTHLSLSRREKEIWTKPVEEEEDGGATPGFKDFMRSFSKGTGGSSKLRSAGPSPAKEHAPPLRVLKAVAGDCMSWFLVEEKDGMGRIGIQLYGVGSGEYGAVGFISDDPEVTPRRMRLPDDAMPVDLSPGRFHVALLFDDGSVRCLGSGQQGQLGSGAIIPDSGEKSISTDLVTVDIGQRVTKLRSGWTHSLALTEDGTLFGWGSSISFQLGESQQHQPRPIAMRMPDDAKVASFDGGLFHSAAITVDNQVYIWGTNNAGQLGASKRALRASPAPFAVELPHSERWVDVQCGLGHTLLLSESGRVFSAGGNIDGQLGRVGSNAGFEQVEGLQNVSRIASTADYSLALEGDHLLGWGCSNDYQLGTGERGTVDVPITALSGNIQDFSAGWTHSFVCIE